MPPSRVQRVRRAACVHKAPALCIRAKLERRSLPASVFNGPPAPHRDRKSQGQQPDQCRERAMRKLVAHPAFERGNRPAPGRGQSGTDNAASLLVTSPPAITRAKAQIATITA